MRVAQLDRAFDYGSKGREFESSRARSEKSRIGMKPILFFYEHAVHIRTSLIYTPFWSAQGYRPLDVSNKRSVCQRLSLARS